MPSRRSRVAAYTWSLLEMPLVRHALSGLIVLVLSIVSAVLAARYGYLLPAPPLLGPPEPVPVVEPAGADREADVPPELDAIGGPAEAGPS